MSVLPGDVIESPCTLLLQSDADETPTKQEDLAKKLESQDDENKIEALKEIIYMMLNGVAMPRLLMPVIKFSIHSDNHKVKKLLLLFWEIVDKKGPDGKLLPEMILVCNALQNDLIHANEYVRGSTLRLVSKTTESQILEQLVSQVQDCLEHRHSYVRKNAVIALRSIFLVAPNLVPDTPQLIEKFLLNEANAQAKRNAFMALFEVDVESASRFLQAAADGLHAADDAFQLATLSLIRRVCRVNPFAKSQFIKSVYQLLQSDSDTVAFEAAATLLALTTLDTAVRAAVEALCKILGSVSDYNVKLVVLARLTALRTRNEKILQESLMDILRTLSNPNIDIRRKVLQLALDLAAPRNIDDVIGFLKKEIVSTESSDESGKHEYRNLLVESIHKCAVRFPEVAQSVVHLLMNYIGDENHIAARDVIVFTREIVEEYPDLRTGILEKLLENFTEIRSPSVFRHALWIIGEYATDPATLRQALETISGAVGQLPLVSPQQRKKQHKGEGDEAGEDAKSTSTATPVGPTTRTVVLADGTYATETIAAPTADDSSAPVGGSGVKGVLDLPYMSLREIIIGGDWYVGATMATAYTKLVLRFRRIVGEGVDTNRQVAQALLLITSLLRLAQVDLRRIPGRKICRWIRAKEADQPMDRNCQEHLLACFRAMAEPSAQSEHAFSNLCREMYSSMLAKQREQEAKKNGQDQDGESSKTRVRVVKQCDDLISLRQLRAGGAIGGDDDFDGDEGDLGRAVGNSEIGGQSLSSRLSRVFQLTGYSDAVYAEAIVSVHSFDIVLDVLVINQTDSTLQNLQLELSTSGDLKLVERPQSYTLAPRAYRKIQANIKVSSTESGVIFGNIVYDPSTAGTDKNIIVMNSIHMDIMDYIKPADCDSRRFSEMWAEFEWENKVPVNTDFVALSEYLAHIEKITNMRILTPSDTLSGASSFLAANLYAKSIFGEDALLNISIETHQQSKISGYIRIRSKTQGIALSLGDKITSHQKKAS